MIEMAKHAELAHHSRASPPSSASSCDSYQQSNNTSFLDLCRVLPASPRTVSSSTPSATSTPSFYSFKANGIASGPTQFSFESYNTATPKQSTHAQHKIKVQAHARAMFGTWKYDPETDEVQNIRRAYDPITARSSQHQACNRCHEKKLRCSGDKGGCDRCVAGKMTCEYSRSGSRTSRRKGSAQAQKSGDASSRAGRENTGSPASISSSQNPPSRSSTKGHRSSRPKTPASSGAESYSSSVAGQIDVPMMMPDDTFDMALLAATTGVEYSAVSAAHYPQQTAYTNELDAWSTAAEYATYPTTCSADDVGYVSATSAQPYAGQHAYQEYNYDDYQIDPRYWSQGR